MTREIHPAAQQSHCATARIHAVGAETCDVLVIGSGAGGLSAAVAAAARGLKVIVAEKAAVFGGTTAVSGGWLWIPGSPHALLAGVVEGPEPPRTYLRHILGNRYDAELIDAFLEAGPRMLSFFEAETEVKFVAGAQVPDFYGLAPGAANGWCSVVTAPYDGRGLGELITQLRRPIAETMLAGMAIASGADMRNFLTALRSPCAFLYVTRRILRHVRDLVTRHRSMQLVNGNALVARLLRSATDAGVTLWSSAGARRLLRDGGAIVGAELEGAGGPVRVTARRAVILATGGFPHDPARQAELFPHVRAGTPHNSAAPETNDGDGLRLAESVGGHVDPGQINAAAWAPVSLVPRADGSTGRFPHLVERGKPGLIAVTRAGKRFVNEGGPYLDYVRAMIAATPEGEEVQSWLICDRRFIRRYGLGAAKPAPLPLRHWLRSGYVVRGRTIEELARACGIDPDGLARAVAAYNRDAVRGEDPEFGRGITPYHRAQGDPDHLPNPCVAPIEQGPFYAVHIVPGSLGTFAGIVTDATARVLDAAGLPIPGLYAVGNDMNSVFGGTYPSGGITLGPAMTFGWLAAQNIADQAESMEDANNLERKTHAGQLAR
jgi:succinate dehydrogenase/fumarate reductase flavoprotein subunit